MNIFLTWSGSRSKTVALALRDWIPTVIQTIDVFMSETDIERGEPWAPKISGQLDKADAGIICLTPENLTAPWILFEAGALSRKNNIGEPRVYTYLFGLRPGDITSPLSTFQHTIADRDGTKRMMGDIRKFGKIDTLSEERLDHVFGKMWPDLETALKNVSAPAVETPHREMHDMVEELLSLVRGLVQREQYLDLRETWQDNSMKRALSLSPDVERFFQAVDRAGAGNYGTLQKLAALGIEKNAAPPDKASKPAES